MRTVCLLIAIVLFIFSCKKDIQTISSSAEQVNAPSLCRGNEWNYSAPFQGDHLEPANGNPVYLSSTKPLIYNNKVYVVDYHDQEVRMHDGTDWQTITSAVPAEFQGGPALAVI